MVPDFISAVAQEAVKDCGEDSFCYGFSRAEGMLAVFDGCGGSGGRKHSAYGGHTEAYIAPRLCQEAFYATIQKMSGSAAPYEQWVEYFAKETAAQCQRALTQAAPTGEATAHGSLVKFLPTTAACLLLFPGQGDMVLAPVWAGDSRAYVLTGSGLAQLSKDDSDAEDAFADIYQDPPMSNLLCAREDLHLSSRLLRLKMPFVALTATDGCYNYYSTPMEFEGVLLGTLMDAASVQDWEERLRFFIGQLAGDDFTLCMAGFGYGSFRALQRSFRDRYRTLQQRYLNPIAALADNDMDSRRALWQEYKSGYYSLMVASKNSSAAEQRPFSAPAAV